MSSYWERKAQAYISQGSKGNSGRRTSSTPATPPPPLGPLIRSIRVSDLDDASTQYQHSATIEGCEAVASYNWLGTDLSKPDILIPGKPPLWKPPSTNPQLEQDSGKFYRDRNAARYPHHPYEPAIATLLQTKPSLVPDLDIVACGSTLGNLLRFVRGQDKMFRFLVEKVGNTIFFIRRENSPKEQIPDVVGYGHTFPKRYTTWEEDAEGSWAHQRLITYRFGGLRFLVRFEADGYLSKDDLPKASPHQAPKDNRTASEKQVGDMLANLSLSDFTTADDTQSSDPTSSVSRPPSIPESPTLPPPLTIRTSSNSPSSIVPQAQVFDLKTRSIKARETKNILEEELPRLWVTQVPNLIVGYHTRGKFFPNDIEIRDVRPNVQQWEKERSKDKTLGKLAAVVRKLVDMVGELEEQWNGERVDKDEDEAGPEVDGDLKVDSDEEENSDEEASDKEDANANQRKIKDEKSAQEGKEEKATKGKSKQVSEHGNEKPTLKTPIPVRIEVVHRAETLGTLEIRHQGWEETSDKDKEGDGRDGVLSYALREQWLAAQPGPKKPTNSTSTNDDNNPEDETSENDDRKSDIYSYRKPGRLLHPFYDSDVSGCLIDPFYDSDGSGYDYGYGDDSDNDNDNGSSGGGGIEDMLTFDASPITPAERARLVSESRLYGGWSRGYGDDEGEVLDYTA
ncbi:hypothetical protein QBC32DRAFT_326938 [Pseudoneurospora amorphoporcata]|uniref:Geranylgeranyl pyrophosphate synthetase n=1 Tax=Pseudoneurospora amorphoporcata TaxID=241081 RepID=A0AAN6SDT7_9PEZI|nr:hypothetical protein QBC32DRAFT_326938 [Pseudoneurospora amorphoporcata]